MKRKQSTEPDLYVINKKPTEKELEAISSIIKEYKSKEALKKKNNKAKA